MSKVPCSDLRRRVIAENNGTFQVKISSMSARVNINHEGKCFIKNENYRAKNVENFENYEESNYIRNINTLEFFYLNLLKNYGELDYLVKIQFGYNHIPNNI